MFSSSNLFGTFISDFVYTLTDFVGFGAGGRFLVFIKHFNFSSYPFNSFCVSEVVVAQSPPFDASLE